MIHRFTIPSFIAASVIVFVSACQSDRIFTDPDEEDVSGGGAGGEWGGAAIGGSDGGVSSSGATGTDDDTCKEECSGDTPLCRDGTCVCLQGSDECVSAEQAKRCLEGLWVTQDCAGQTPVCYGGECVQCTPGDVRCSEDRLGLRECSSEGIWSPKNCTHGCANGECLPAGTVVHPDQVTCDTDSGEICSATSECCYITETSSGNCGPVGDCSQSGTVNTIECDGPNDCSGETPSCCYVQSGSGPRTECRDDCNAGGQEFVATVCDPGDPVCPDGEFCTSAPFNETAMYRCQ